MLSHRYSHLSGERKRTSSADLDLRDRSSVFENSRDVCLHPLRERLNMNSQFAAKWGQAVFHFGRFGRKDDSQYEAISLERMQ